MGRASEPAGTQKAGIFDSALEVVEDKALTGPVNLDNASFDGCRFRNAVLIYSGGPPPMLRDCTFENVSFEFGGAAGRTLALLQAMGHPGSGLRDIVKASFPRIFGQ